MLMHIPLYFVQVIQRMNKLGLSVSHPHTLKIVRLLGENHDQEWKERSGTVTAESHAVLQAHNSPVSNASIENSGSSETSEIEADEPEVTSVEITSDCVSEQLISGM